MGMIRIKKTDMAKINAYMELSGALVEHDAGRWIISTPQETIIFDSIADLMDDIRANLETMHELVKEGQIEQELWDAAWKEA